MYSFVLVTFTKIANTPLDRSAALVYAAADEVDAYMFYRCFFLFFSVSFFCFFVFSVHQKNTRQPFSGTSERIFMKLLPNDSGEM